MTERDGVVLRNLRRDFVAPRIRPRRSTEQPTDEPPHSEAQQNGDPKNPAHRRWIILQMIHLRERTHWFLTAAQTISSTRRRPSSPPMLPSWKGVRGIGFQSSRERSGSGCGRPVSVGSY